MELSEAITRILVAVSLGGLIGVEREFRDKSAGFRTLILIAAGSALFTIISFTIASQYSDGSVDPTRIISYIISGIGFLGAGVIIKDGTAIKGLTTAASIWLTAAVGMAAGAGLFAIAAIAAGLVLFALIVLPPIEHWIDDRHEFKHYIITVKSKEALDSILRIFSEEGLKVFKHSKSRQEKCFKLSIHADGSPDTHHRVNARLIDHPEIISF